MIRPLFKVRFQNFKKKVKAEAHHAAQENPVGDFCGGIREHGKRDKINGRDRRIFVMIKSVFNRTVQIFTVQDSSTGNIINFKITEPKSMILYFEQSIDRHYRK